MRNRPPRIGAIGMTVLIGQSLIVFSASRVLAVEPPDSSPKTGTNSAVSEPNRSKDAFAREAIPFLAKHCYSCHGGDKKKGDVSLDQDKTDLDIQKRRDVWEDALDMIRSGEMPPKKRPRPTDAEIAAVVRGVEAALANLDCTGPRDPGRVTMRRLNKIEYNNTIRDLIGIDFKPATDFPNDDVGYGFDNIGDVLSLSPLLLEKYLIAADSILDQAIVRVDPPKPVKERMGGLRVRPGVGEERRGLFMLESNGAVTGQMYVEEGDYYIRALVFARPAGDEPVRAALRVDGVLLKEFEIKAERDAPQTIEAKTHLKQGTARVSLFFLNPYTEPAVAEADRKNALAVAGSKEDKNKNESNAVDRSGGKVEPDRKAAAEKKEPRRNGGRRGDFSYDDWLKDSPARRRLFVRSIELDGPHDAPPPALPETHKRIMAHRSDASPREAAREIVARFAPRAFRRPVKPEEIEKILKIYDLAEKEGESFEDRVKLALARVLVSPHFLYRIELDPAGAKPGSTYLINEYELASRLSYFFWSTTPDDELFDLASKGELRKNLEAQVARLIRDPKSSEFIRNFSSQWLTTRKLAFVSPDPKTFPNFDEELREAMARETELFFEAIVREDRSVLDFLDADFSFVNERLARHYGIEGVKGKEFRRVKLPPNRGGILTQASVLTLTSNPTRTSPVKRGKWVLEQILNTPPPPPPPDVPALTEDRRLTGSLRKVMEQHRENPMCASCHRRMDPIGFAFENYDAIGAWREKDEGYAIDPSGTLPDGKSFQGPGELKKILKSKSELFCRCLVEKMLTYATGRGLEFQDRCAVDKILAALKQNDDRFSTLLFEVVKSEPFQMRTASGEQP